MISAEPKDVPADAPRSVCRKNSRILGGPTNGGVQTPPWDGRMANKVRGVGCASPLEIALWGFCPDRPVANKVGGGGELASYFLGLHVSLENES